MNPPPLTWAVATAAARGHRGQNVAAENLKRFLSAHPPACLRSPCSPRPRYYSSQPAPRADERPTAQGRDGQLAGKRDSYSLREKQRQLNKEFFTNLLSSAATKRDAKAYLSRLKNPTTVAPDPGSASASASASPAAPPGSGTALGQLYTKTRAAEDSPVFSQFHDADRPTEGQEPVHVALVKISGVSEMSRDILHGIAKTLCSLSRLSMSPCVVLEESSQLNGRARRLQYNAAVDRLATTIDDVGDVGARRIDNLFTLGEDGRPEVFLRKLVTRPLRRGRIPLVVPIAYCSHMQHSVPITPDEAVLALTRELAGLNFIPRTWDHHFDHGVTSPGSMYKLISLDRIIVVDGSGSIPATNSKDQRHVFVNLDQEYSRLQEELRSSTDRSVSEKHASNLKMFRDALKLLPHSSSGLLTTPEEAANTARAADEEASNVGTRRQRNPLIHNLLTDKPAYSSSLPTGRLGQASPSAPATASTFVKRGMPLTILPNPAAQVWTAFSRPRLRLDDARIDLERLTYLIDDSFNRTLDVEAYLRRVNDRLAGVIIAGDYEGGAILTWETPPGASDDDAARLVPYLDKFAVLKKSQGAGGVADIVFNAMVHTCFPDGVCWRSRKDNPVNKWYFERSRGTWKIPDSNWTMFWTTPEITAASQSQRFLDYEGVCRTVQPTWADGKKLADKRACRTLQP